MRMQRPPSHQLLLSRQFLISRAGRHIPVSHACSVMTSKWDAYYTDDAVLKTPWDTNEESSQLRAYLSQCPASACDRHRSSRDPLYEYAVIGELLGHQPVGSSNGPPPAYHVCKECSHLKPDAPTLLNSKAVQATEQQAHQQACVDSSPLMLELCCGTGASLAYAHRMGFACLGVDIVPAACEAARQRLSKAADSRAPTSKEHGTAHATTAPQWSVLQDNVFSVQLPWSQVDLAYDCQGLHAMPPEQRLAYVDALLRALKPGGFLLLLVGRDAVGEPASWDKDSGDGQSASSQGLSAAGGIVGSGDSGRPARPGPSCMSRQELEALFPVHDWTWHFCLHSRFDLTPYYQTLPCVPPAWCLLLQKQST